MVDDGIFTVVRGSQTHNRTGSEKPCINWRAAKDARRPNQVTTSSKVL